jgi:DNA polymerase I
MTSASFRPQLTNKPILRTRKITNHANRSLLVIDGDSFAHRAYHAIPKSIRRRGNKGGGAIVGFANFLLRLYESERPRAVLVGWDTLDVLTYRHRAFAAYQSGREFDAELRDQLDVLPHFATACGFVSAKSPGYEADDFLAAAVASEELRGGKAIVATGDRDAFQLASEMTPHGQLKKRLPARCKSSGFGPALPPE